MPTSRSGSRPNFSALVEHAVFYSVKMHFLQESTDPLYRRLWLNSAQYPENRVTGSHIDGMMRALKEDYVYMGSITGLIYYAYTGIHVYNCTHALQPAFLITPMVQFGACP